MALYPKKFNNLKKNSLDLVILCGGRGKRLGNITKKIPKPLLKINNIEFLTYLLNYYKKFDFNKIYLLTGYKSHLFNKFKKKKYNQIDVEIIREKISLGTAGCLAQLKKKKIKDFLLINGDSFIDIEYENIFKKKNNSKLINMFLVKNKNYKENKKLQNLDLDKSNVKFSKKSNLMNSGVYLCKKEILKLINDNQNISLEDEIIPDLIKKKRVGGKILEKSIIDIGIKKNLLKAKKILKSFFLRPAVFLDRDGVLNYDHNYVHKYSQFKWMPGSIKALEYINKKNYHLFIITNQSGIGRGYYTEKCFYYLHSLIKKFLIKKRVFIDDVEFCPHHPNAAKKIYRKICQCRKPGNYMIKKLKFNWPINISKSIMIGDQKSDKICANASGIIFYYREKNLYKQIRKLI